MERDEADRLLRSPSLADGATLTGEPGSGEEGARPGSLLQPLRLRSAGEQIAERLLTAIALGEFPPGQRLPTERDLADVLGVSRTSVREALHRLAAGGYVEVQRGRYGGAVVQAGWGPATDGLTWRTVRQDRERLEWLFDFRSLVEPLVARVAAERRGPGGPPPPGGGGGGRARGGGGPEGHRAADQALHDAVARATHNPYLVGICRQVRVQLSLAFGAMPHDRSLRDRALAEHTALARAVVAGDPDGAARAAGEHATSTESSVRELRRRMEEEGSG